MIHFFSVSSCFLLHMWESRVFSPIVPTLTNHILCIYCLLPARVLVFQSCSNEHTCRHCKRSYASLSVNFWAIFSQGSYFGFAGLSINETVFWLSMCYQDHIRYRQQCSTQKLNIDITDEYTIIIYICPGLLLQKMKQHTTWHPSQSRYTDAWLTSPCASHNTRSLTVRRKKYQI